MTVPSVTDDLLAEIEAAATSPRKVFVCTDCEGVYADRKVSQCDCMGKEVYTEAFIANFSASTILALITRLRDSERDAERYRWLIDSADMMHWENMLGFADLEDSESVGHFIDAAITKERTE